MTKQIAWNLKSFGDANNFEKINIDLADQGTKQLTISQSYFTINPIDIIIKKGIYQKYPLPVVLGDEALGIIHKAGSEVNGDGLKEGSKVIYATGPFGAYCDYRIMDQDYLVAIPPEVDETKLIGCYSKGLTAHYLLKRVVNLVPGSVILVHDATSGNGQALCQVANHYGITVLGTVNKPEKVESAKNSGCHFVFDTSTIDFIDEVNKITNNIGVAAVYDFVGGDFFSKSLKCLNFFGMMVSLGGVKGIPTQEDLTQLDEKCLFVCRPRLDIYKANRMELLLSANEVFKLIGLKVLNPITAFYNFDDLPKAHEDAASDNAKGTFIVTVN